MNRRGPWQGMLTIVRLNWPFYACAAFILALCFVGLLGPAPPWGKVAAGLGALGCAYFLLGSLGVSHLIYDRSDLYRWRWLKRATAGTPSDVILCHSGFDEASAALRAEWPTAHWQVLDHFDAATMTEPSIRRARALMPPTSGTVPAPFDRWPLPAGSADVIFGLLAIHEFRRPSERTAWFAEARRCLRPGGRIVLAEHVRDVANFLAFGPGFLHFHSRAAWESCWVEAGLRLHDEFRITPWVRIFVLTV